MYHRSKIIFFLGIHSINIKFEKVVFKVLKDSVMYFKLKYLPKYSIVKTVFEYPYSNTQENCSNLWSILIIIGSNLKIF